MDLALRGGLANARAGGIIAGGAAERNGSTVDSGVSVVLWEALRAAGGVWRPPPRAALCRGGAMEREACPTPPMALQVGSLLARWQREGRPDRNGYLEAAAALDACRRTGGGGLWPRPPLFASATLDDAWGQGLEVIHRLAEAVGMRLLPLGLRRPPAEIVERCRRVRPAFLGVTVLWGESEEALRRLAEGLPSGIRLLAGGPAFAADPQLARRAGLPAAVLHGAGFLERLLACALEDRAAPVPPG
jgi:hypothetical protein